MLMYVCFWGTVLRNEPTQCNESIGKVHSLYLALKVFLIDQVHMESHACQGWLTLQALTTMVHLIMILLLGTLDSILFILNTASMAI